MAVRIRVAAGRGRLGLAFLSLSLHLVDQTSDHALPLFNLLLRTTPQCKIFEIIVTTPPDLEPILAWQCRGFNKVRAFINALEGKLTLLIIRHCLRNIIEEYTAFQ